MSTADVAVPLTIRPAMPNDLDPIVGIERRAFTDPWSRRSFAELLDRPEVAFLVAMRGTALAGYAVVYVAADEAELANFAVHASVRRQGIGQRFLEAVLAEALARGAADVWLEVRASNDAARALYHAAGFAEVGVRKRYYVRPVEDAIVMRRLTASQ